MPAQVTNYKCPTCTGPLHFVGASGKLECDYCGASSHQNPQHNPCGETRGQRPLGH